MLALPYIWCVSMGRAIEFIDHTAARGSSGRSLQCGQTTKHPKDAHEVSSRLHSNVFCQTRYIDSIYRSGAPGTKCKIWKVGQRCHGDETHRKPLQSRCCLDREKTSSSRAIESLGIELLWFAMVALLSSTDPTTQCLYSPPISACYRPRWLKDDPHVPNRLSSTIKRAPKHL